MTSFRILALLLFISVFQRCKPGWEADYKKQFIETCLSGEGRFHTSPQAYCDCALQKTMQRYPNPGQLLTRTDTAAYQQDLQSCPD